VNDSGACVVPNAPILVQTHRLTKIYGGHSEGAVQIRALDHVDLTVHEGEMLAVMGPSGSGKSTLLNMLGALDTPTSGDVDIAGQRLAEVKDLARFRAQMVGFIFQMHNLIPTLTAVENVEVPLRGQRISGARYSARRRRERAREMLALVGLSDRENHVPAQLSGGQRQRVAIARALVNDPRLILADEPTGNLDSTSGDQVMNLIRDLNQSHGTTILVVTHDRQVAQCTKRIISMLDGKIVDEHWVSDPLTEDLRNLARSNLGRALIDGDIPALSGSPFVCEGALDPIAQELATYLSDLI
jgi:ABC-type lipoprotein export system ATPase subunit